jgi:uncharacterized protein YacL
MEATPEVIEATNKLIDAATVKPSAQKIMVIFTLIGLLTGLICIGTLVVLPPLGLLLTILATLTFCYFFMKNLRKKMQEQKKIHETKLAEYNRAWEKSKKEKEKKIAEGNKRINKQLEGKRLKRPRSTTSLDSFSRIDSGFTSNSENFNRTLD